MSRADAAHFEPDAGRSEEKMKTKWVILFVVMGVICGLVLNFLIVLAVAFLAQVVGFDSRGLIDVVNILSWPLGFFVSYRLWPPKPKSAPPTEGEKPTSPERKARRRWPWVVAAFGCIVMTLVFFVWLAASLRQTDDGWETVRAPDGSFSVLMPGTPEHEQTDATSLAFGKVRANILMLEQGQWGYTVSWVDYPTGSYADADLDASLDEARNGAVEGVQGTLLGEEHITIQGYPGRRIRVAPAAPQASAIMTMLAVGDRLYSLSVVCPKEQSFSPKITKFLDSFTLLKKGPPNQQVHRTQ